VPDTGERGKKYMKKTINYTDEPMGDLKVVNDFLPSPQELAFKEDTVKVTIALSKSSIKYFKRVATKYHVPYQKMIRRLLDEYVGKQQKMSS
jgi:predicted DNA binding CopG/RHH family protein